MVTATITPEEEILTDLAHKLVDQIALYGLARQKAASPRIAAAIQRAKEQRAQLLQEINAKIWLNELPPIQQGEKLGTARKAFSRLQEMDTSDEIALAEVERGEDYLFERVARGINDERLSSHTRNYLQTVLSRVDRTHDEISALRNVTR